jgi:CheY-like chemotaxis protein
VLTASDGQDALEVFRDNADEISLILMDLTMPRMGGIAAFRNLRQIDKDVKIILSSGYNEQDAVSTLAGKGLAEFIQKPYRMEQLISKIRKVLGDV